MKAVILAGGSGSRLWPLSTKNTPKQFQKMLSDKTMLQETITRLHFLNPEDIYISTNEKYVPTIKKQIKPYKIPEENIIIEPALRDTAPCIGLAAIHISIKHPKEVMSIIYADHLIKHQKEFEQKLKATEKIAKQEKTLNIIEVKAKYPNVNLGYVKIGNTIKTIEKNVEICEFEGFREKPDLKTAKKFLESYKYIWNTGLYVWRIDTILEQYKKHLPKMYNQLLQIKEGIKNKNTKIIKKIYPKCEKISIDYGIMEKVNRNQVRIIPAELGWSDIGTWEAILEELETDKDGNLINANHIGINTKNTLIYGNKEKIIATIGVKDLAIVETKNAILVCKKNQSQDVKKIVQQLEEKKLDNYL